MNYLKLKINASNNFIDINLFEKPITYGLYGCRNVSFVECFTNKDVMNLYLFQTYVKQQGYGNLMLAILYQQLKEKNVQYIESNVHIQSEYSNEEYVKFIKQIGFRQTWFSHLIGPPKYYAPIPNPLGDAFSNMVLDKYSLVPKTKMSINGQDLSEYEVKHRISDKVSNIDGA